MENIDDAKRGKYSQCRKQKLFEGFSEHEADTACAKYLVDEVVATPTREFNTLFIDSDYVTKKIIDFYKGRDALELTNVIERSRSLSLSKFSTLIKAIKSRVGLKVGAMGILPMKTSLPMKNLNRLQTKMEKQVTEESKWLTSEQYEQRKQYAKYMRKADADIPDLTDEEFIDSLGELYTEIINYYPELPSDEAIDRAFMPPQGDKAWVMSNESEIISMNDGLNNIIKAPIILAKEMVQRYDTEDGGIEYHFKPYNELKLAVERAKENGPLDIIIEHQDIYDEDKVIGHVKEIRAHDSTKSIRGMGYFNIAKMADGLKQMIKNGDIIPVSIGFLAILGDGGVWNGIEYKHTQKDINMMHLAVCLESVPRCPAGVCGVNLKDAKTDKIKIFTIINKNPYYYNICNIYKDSKKETNNKNISNIKKEVKPMQNDADKQGKIAADEPDDLEAILTRLRKFMAGQVDLDNYTNRILAALGIKKKSDSEMDEKQFQDALKSKDSEIEELKVELEDARKSIAKFEEKERQNYIKIIKKFGDKFSDEELQKKKLESLEEIADAVSRFAPSEPEAAILPVAGKDDKVEMEKKVGKVERVDPFSLFEDVNEEFNMSGL